MKKELDINIKKFLIVETKERTKNRFKAYCRKQGFSMVQGINALMEMAVRKNLPIKIRMRMKSE